MGGVEVGGVFWWRRMAILWRHLVKTQEAY
jgi:hypothetical protein